MSIDDLRSRARQLRKEQTEAESKLWSLLRSRRFVGFKFRRQQPLDKYFADFCCLKARLILELDGEQHASHESYDERRTRYLEAQGFRVLRFWNSEVMNEEEMVLEAIYEALQLPSPALRAPSPARGEGKS